MNVVRYIGSQFSNPRGIGGRISTYVMNRLNWRQYQCVIGIFHKRTPKTVLDIGFGNGYLMGKLAKMSSARLTGIEVSEDMIEQASKRHERLVRAQRMSLLKGDVVSMEFQDAVFDFVYTVNTVYFWQDLEKGYAEIYRVLKKNGIFVNNFYSRSWLDRMPYTRYDFVTYEPEVLLDAVRSMGFRKVKLIELKKGSTYSLIVWK